MNNAGRWWEFYFVRYAIGTLVGAFVVNQAFRIHEPLRAMMLFGLDGDANPIPRTSLVLGYGLLFCYIASIPILVLHAARFALFPFFLSRPQEIKKEQTDEKPRRRKRLSEWRWTRADWHSVRSLAALSAFLVIGVFLIKMYQKLSDLPLTPDALTKAVVSAALVVTWLEWAALLVLLVFFDRTYAGYKALAKKRKTNGNDGGFIDSYRHLREHGNSILIVIMEFVFGAAFLGSVSLLSAETDFITEFARGFLPFLLLWMLPGALIWFIATFIELRFAGDSDVDWDS